MKSIILILTFCLYMTSFAQNDSIKVPVKFEYADSCMDPTYESMIWMSLKGKVIKVVNGNTLIIKAEDGSNKKLILTGVDPFCGGEEYADSAKHLLLNLVLNEEVSATVNPSDLLKAHPVKEEFVCVVHTRHISVNRTLIEYGYAAYKTPAPSTLSGYSNCVYQILERKAKREKRGMWNKADFNPPDWIIGQWENYAESNTHNFVEFIFKKNNILFIKGFELSQDDSSTMDFSKKFSAFTAKEISDSSSYKIVLTNDDSVIEYEFKKIEMNGLVGKTGLTYSIMENNKLRRDHLTAINCILLKK